MQKYLIIAGILLVLIGILYPLISKIPFGRLPGDIIIEKPNFRLYIPITTMFLLSLFFSAVIWLIRKFF